MKKDHKKTWRTKARELLTEAFGGACTICGYNKCRAALDFHHVDPKQKDALLSIAMRQGYAWASIVEEARKCTILCCRCHRELHANLVELPDNYAKFNEDYLDVIKLRKQEFDNCPICNQEKKKKLHFCSPKCAAIGQMKFNITKEDLEKLVINNSYEKVGQMFGVTGNTIKKRCQKMGIDIGCRLGYWSKLKHNELENTPLINLIEK